MTHKDKAPSPLERLFEKMGWRKGGYGSHVKVRPNGSRYIDADEYFRGNAAWQEKVSQLDSLFEEDTKEKTEENRDV